MKNAVLVPGKDFINKSHKIFALFWAKKGLCHFRFVKKSKTLKKVFNSTAVLSVIVDIISA